MLPSAEELDARMLGTLVRRGLVEIRDGETRPTETEAGERYFEERVRRRRRVRSRRPVTGDPADRAEAVLQAARELERVLPRARSLKVEDLEIETPDLLAALQLVRTGQPQPES